MGVVVKGEGYRESLAKGGKKEGERLAIRLYKPASLPASTSSDIAMLPCLALVPPTDNKQLKVGQSRSINPSPFEPQIVGT